MKEERRKSISERERNKVKAELVAQEKSRLEKRLTVKQFGEQWTTHKLYELHGEVNALREKASAKDDAYRLGRYVYPVRPEARGRCHRGGHRDDHARGAEPCSGAQR